jgi:hypothetical protein
VREGAADQPAARRVHSAGVLCGQGLWRGLGMCGAGGSQERYSAARGCLALGFKRGCRGRGVSLISRWSVFRGVKATEHGRECGTGGRSVITAPV